MQAERRTAHGAGKFQITNSKSQTILNVQITKLKREQSHFEFVVCLLKFVWYLGLGYWDFRALCAGSDKASFQENSLSYTIKNRTGNRHR
ncbi:MAG: hypothetical protein A2655_02700 [Candidatus Yanofskybacteria bacterium RIFCSPHIGHO2_01_FULL_43_42]|uniref:Uncharacterized protein n=1 Tax=Candidatus Yanofskybacteria bacterium RIFCSPLOWO2_01_FULL_43_22 TaxID=1802695 RepID=A0A1F8GHR9_9BACT|nr:MAG: hypothetical protein A2655_02700 [Candidatus Yanofskybacteria bacterium RIFCSPHIGHO2_01_FULL_43_42]OGN24947.1 MAG: hypothetical protein A3A13_01490 [Candidatus Yanofskybacteria bacterium RIFCSPLOWO2_01_FULL_43_22]